jgi:hypothetical protein
MALIFLSYTRTVGKLMSFIIIELSPNLFDHSNPSHPIRTNCKFNCQSVHAGVKIPRIAGERIIKLAAGSLAMILVSPG